MTKIYDDLKDVHVAATVLYSGVANRLYYDRECAKPVPGEDVEELVIKGAVVIRDTSSETEKIKLLNASQVQASHVAVAGGVRVDGENTTGLLVFFCAPTSECTLSDAELEEFAEQINVPASSGSGSGDAATVLYAGATSEAEYGLIPLYLDLAHTTKASVDQIINAVTHGCFIDISGYTIPHDGFLFALPDSIALVVNSTSRSVQVRILSKLADGEGGYNIEEIVYGTGELIQSNENS